MSTARSSPTGALETQQAPAPVRVFPVPWRDPQTVFKQELARDIGSLETACRESPKSADLRTRLGLAHAMNYDVYKSMDALEAAVLLDGTHFFAQMKYAELFYRLRALPKAEEETLKAVNLAKNGWELSIAKRQPAGDPPADPRRDTEAGVEQAAEGADSAAVGYDRDSQSDRGGVEMKWRYFIGAGLLGGYVMLLAGAPLYTVLVGIAFSAAWNAFKHRGQGAYEKN
jgi:hypothetical protein